MSPRTAARRTSQRGGLPEWRCARCGKRGTAPTFGQRIEALHDHYDAAHPRPASAEAAA